MEKIHSKLSGRTAQARNDERDRIELLRSRVNLLTGKERLLMTMYLDNENSFRQMSRLSGLNESSVARRIRKITKRLLNCQYVTCLRNRNRFSKTEMAIAKDYFLRGLSMRKIAKKRNWTYYHVRKIMKKIQRIVKDNAQQIED
jgi:predicted DNA-binding protein YlxM (UPF0122 family)